MRKSNTQNIGSVIQQLINDQNLGPKLKEVKTLRLWKELLGKGVERNTKKIYVKDQVLIVYLSSSVVRAELFMIRESIKQRINEHLKDEFIKEIDLR